MHDVAGLREYMQRAKKSVHQCFQMFGTDRGQPHDSDALVFRTGGVK